MRLAPLLFLLPAVAQDVPSLQRSSAALPITESIPTLRARLGGKGGPFAAAQLVLSGTSGQYALFEAAEAEDPLRRLDAVYGLGQIDGSGAYYGLALALGDPDPRVAEEASHGLRIAGRRAVASLLQAARTAPATAADAAVAFLWGYERVDDVAAIARSPRAGGRAGAIRVLSYGGRGDLRLFESAADDGRDEVRRTAMRAIVFAPKTPAREAALDRLARSPNPAVRLSLVRAMDEDPGLSLDAAYERAQRHGPPGSRRVFARMVAGNLYDPSRLRAATAILARLANDPARSVGDAAVEELYLFVEDRLGGGGYGSSGIDAEDVPWDDLPPATLDLLRRGVGKRLRGPLAFKAAIVLARLRDPRAYPALAPAAFDGEGEKRRLATIAIGASGDRRATPRLLRRLDRYDGDYAVYDALQRLRDPTTIPALLRLVRGGASSNDSPILAAQTIAAIGDRSAAPALVAIAREPGNGTNLYVPLGRLGGPAATRFLLERLAQDPQDLIQYATLGLGQLSDPADVAELRRFAESGSPRAASAKQALDTVAYHAQIRRQERG